MECQSIREQLGPYLDEELAPQSRRSVQAHLDNCLDCRTELYELQRMCDRLVPDAAAAVPEKLWTAIEDELDRPRRVEPPIGPPSLLTDRRRVAALAATIMLLVGAGMIGLLRTEPRVEAADVDFSVLLDALPLDAHKAFRRFLVRYDARECTPLEARRHARDLNFVTPDLLPGGFRLERVYRLRFGNRPGVAAAYRKNDEFLGAIFHPPVPRGDYGTHKDYDCVIGKHRGHKVRVGEWSLVHLTDRTTCRCILSRLDEESELPDILYAVAPELAGAADHHGP